MNRGHLEFCASPQWREIVEETVLPEALRGVSLGDDVIEVGPGPGLTTDVLRTMTTRLTAVEFDPHLAAALADRLADTMWRSSAATRRRWTCPDGRFSGAASFHMLHHIATDDAQDAVFAELARVLRPGGVFVAVDGVESEGLRQAHVDDVCNPIDPETLRRRLSRAGFASIEVRLYDLGWICTTTSLG